MSAGELQRGARAAWKHAYSLAVAHRLGGSARARRRSSPWPPTSATASTPTTCTASTTATGSSGWAGGARAGRRSASLARPSRRRRRVERHAADPRPPCIGRRPGEQLHPHLADGAAAAGAARRAHAAGRRGPLLRRPHGGDPLRRADRPGGDHRRDLHRAARLPDRQRVPPARRAGGDGRLPRHALPGRGGAPRRGGGRRRGRGALAARCVDDCRHGRREGLYRARARPLARRAPPRPHASSAASATCRWRSSRPAAAATSAASSAPSRRSTARSRTRRPGGRRRRRTSSAPPRSGGSSSSSTTTSAPTPSRARELLDALARPGVRWVSQCSIKAAHDEELRGAPGARPAARACSIGFESLDPAAPRGDGQGVQRARAATARRSGTCGATGSASTAPSSSATTATARGRSTQPVDFAARGRLFLAAFDPLMPFPGTPLYRRLEAEGRLLYDRWWLDPEYRFGQVELPARRG